MHRSPLCMLVLCAAVAAACSTHDDPRSGELLSHDSTLVARLDVGRETPRQATPEACRTNAVTASTAIVNKPLADTLARRAYDAEILGNVKEAQTLLRRASDLDGTNKTTEYHLARTSESLGDRPAAITAYCRYLALTPTASESAEARERVASLAQSEGRASGSGTRDSVATGTHARVASARREATRPTETRVAESRSEKSRAATTPRVATQSATSRVGTRRATHERPAVAPRDDANTANAEGAGASAGPTVAQAAARADSTSSNGDVSATSTPEPAVEQPPTDSRPASRGPSRTQSAGIGAAAGAIIGAATGRGVKGALIGAATGGILGGAMGGRR